MPRPEVLIFDVNETLLDLTPVNRSIANALDGRNELVTLWFTTTLHFSVIGTVADQFHDFGTIAVAALETVARDHGIRLTDERAKEAVAPIRTLPAHDDVKPALAKLRDAGYRMVTLTNSSEAVLESQMESSGLRHFFDHTFSVEQVGLYKPHTHVYHWAAQQLDAEPAESMMVAAHGWAIAGALWAGLRGAFVARPGRSIHPLGPKPELFEPDMGKVAERLVAME